MTRKHGSEPGAKRPMPDRYESFAAGLEERSRLRQVSFAARTRDLDSIQKAKRRFGAAAVCGFVADVLRAAVRLLAATRK